LGAHRDAENGHRCSNIDFRTRQTQQRSRSTREEQGEIALHDEQPVHDADVRISRKREDGEKMNYGKFGDLLAEVKTVDGRAGDD